MFLLYVPAFFFGRINALALDESVDWQSFDLPFALVLGHACPVVLRVISLYRSYVYVGVGFDSPASLADPCLR